MEFGTPRKYTVALIGAVAIVSMQCAKSSPSSPSSEGSAPLSSSNALGDSTTSTPEAGIVKICKVGNVDGTFTITAVTGTPSVLSPVTVAHGACRIVAQNGTIPAPVTQSASFTETSAGLQSATIERCQNTTVGGACTSTGSSAFTNGGTVQFISNGDEKAGATITFTNNVTPPAQLSVAKSDNGTFTSGGQATYTIVVRNPAAAGAQSAVNVQLTDALPGNGGLVWTTATPTQGSCTNPIVGNALSCSLGTIAPQGQVTVTVTTAATTPAAACQSQPNPAANATANGGLSATDSGSLTCTPPPPTVAQFVIGDVEAHSAIVHDIVNFWGAQWWKNNQMSGVVDNGVASFKGFATQSDNVCGGKWISLPGNSSDPPATIPSIIEIIVTDTVLKDGPNISGNIKQIIRVAQDGGYGPNPGHDGNGPVVSVRCP